MSETEVSNKTQASKSTLKLSNRVAAYAAATLAAITLLVGGWYGYVYASTPEHLRKPTYQHYHYRTQILVNGKAVDFSKDEFQVVSGNSTTCSAEVGSIPIDFHDKMDHLTLVHWNGMTGGEFL